MSHRILFVNRFFYPDHSATSQILSDLAFYLADRGHSPVVITSRLRYEDPGARLVPREKLHGVEVHRVWTSRFGRGSLAGRAIDYLTFYLSTSWRLLRLVRPADLVVAMTDPPLISVVAGWVTGLRRARLVNWLQDLFPEVATALDIGVKQGAVGNLLVRLRNRSLGRAAMNVAIGEGMRRRLLDLGLDDSRVRVVHNWSDDERIRPLPAGSSPLRHEWGLEGKLVVGYSGNLGRAHEYQTLLAAAEGLGERNDIVFLFIGGGVLMAGLRAETEARGLGNLMFRPYQPAERLEDSLAVPDIHIVVLRPELEGLIVPSKLYGIAAAGRPTIFIGSLEGEIAGLLSKSDAGFAVRTGDGAALKALILRLLDDPPQRDRLGRNARRMCDEHFSRRMALERWERVLAAAADGQS